MIFEVIRDDANFWEIVEVNKGDADDLFETMDSCGFKNMHMFSKEGFETLCLDRFQNAVGF